MKPSPPQISAELLRKYDRPGPRYTSYPTVPMWSDDITSEDYKFALSRSAETVDSPLAVYCHIPFCRRRCLYCGCNTCITKKAVTVDRYLNHLTAEITRAGKALRNRRAINQLHFGGGTPTFIGEGGLTRVLESLEEQFHFTEDCERSIEIDPRETTRDMLEFLSSRGFNRISLGVQDFDPEVQKAIGRIQPSELVETVLRDCRRLGFGGINFDLIYGLPRQTQQRFIRTLERTIQLRPERVAVYSFAYLPKLRPHQSLIQAGELPSTEDKYRLFAAAIERFTESGYRQIGMDHFALPADELAEAQADGRLSRNFMGYTVKTSPDMIGFGMSAISYIDNAFFQNASRLGDYNAALEDGQWAVFRGLRLSQEDLLRQWVIMSLMCNFVLPFDELKRRFGITYKSYFAAEHKQLAGFLEDGLLEATEAQLIVTPLGRTFVRNIAMTFDPYLTRNDTKARPTFSRTI